LQRLNRRFGIAEYTEFLNLRRGRYSCFTQTDFSASNTNGFCPKAATRRCFKNVTMRIMQSYIWN